MRPIDLTMTISENLPAFPGSPKPHLIPWESIVPDGYNLELLFFSSHSGTHMDAPRHFLQKGRTIDQIPTSRLATKAVLVKIEAPPNGRITRKDIVRYESGNGAIHAGSAVVFSTGWSKRLQDESYFKKNPGLSAAAARYLASRHVGMVGIDSPSIDAGNSPGFPAHHILCGCDILIVENLVNLDRIKKPKFKLVVLPLKLKGATGSPVRAIAV